jgi:hypothetical protein
MQITKNSLKTSMGPSEWFTGAVYVDTVAAPSSGSRLSASSVHFTPGAHRLAHASPRTDDLRHRGCGPLPTARRADRGHSPRRPRLLRAQ